MVIANVEELKQQIKKEKENVTALANKVTLLENIISEMQNAIRDLKKYNNDHNDIIDSPEQEIRCSQIAGCSKDSDLNNESTLEKSVHAEDIITHTEENPHEWEGATSDDEQPTSYTYCKALQSMDDEYTNESSWKEEINKKNKRREIKKHTKLSVVYDEKKGRSVFKSDNGNHTLLIGARREKKTVLYLRNIYTGDKDDEQIATDIRKYAVGAGFRVMYAEVIHNRYCQDVIGCKIWIPLSQVEDAMEYGVWPDGITCRMWAQKRNNQENSNYYGKEK